MNDGNSAAWVTGATLLSEAGGETPSDAELMRRFSDARDPRAFEMLVQRYGPLVQGVCRRVLGNVHDAEDAFQATFLVLAKKAGTLRNPERLGNWLYGVSFRVARKAQQRGTRRTARERRYESMSIPPELLDLEWQELRSVLDEELNNLPEKYRAPLVLCYLGGLTNAEAAEQLGWPGGSISGRLARARDALRRRLNRRGLSLSAGLLALLLAQKANAAPLPRELIRETAARAVQYVGGAEAANVVPASVAELAEPGPGGGASRMLKLAGLSLVGALLLVSVLTLVGESHGQSWRVRQAASSRSSAVSSGVVQGGNDPAGASTGGCLRPGAASCSDH